MSKQSWRIAHALAFVFGTIGSLRAEEPVTPRVTPAQAERRIEEILDGPLRSPLDFAETPLNTILQAISEEYSIPIVFDVTALEAVAQVPETEVTIAIGNVTLRSALDLMLKNVSDVTYMVDNEVLLVTTEDEEQTRLEVRVYRVDDLNSPDIRGEVHYVGSGVPYFDSMVDAITSSVEPESWQENGTGEGDISPFGSGVLVIMQTRRVHGQIAELLEALRTTRAAIAADTTEDGPYITRGVKVYEPSLSHDPVVRDAIRAALMASVDWTSTEEDKAAHVMLQVLPDRVIVRHRPAVVRSVLGLLDDLSLQTQEKTSRVMMGSGAGGSGGAGFEEEPPARPTGASKPKSNGRRGGF
jgi:hypothetical protein